MLLLSRGTIGAVETKARGMGVASTKCVKMLRGRRSRVEIIEDLAYGNVTKSDML